MKKLVFTLLLLSIVCGLRAQYVTIPDSNFRRELVRLYPSCFNANQEMDTTCSAVVNGTFLAVGSMNISDLDGIHHFTNLLELYCSSNQLTSLPALPSGLQNLACSNNQLTSLPALPSSLQTLSCHINQLTSLPALSGSLQSLYCSSNQLTSLPALPSGLQTLSCHINQLTSLPALPSGLQNLACSNNQLTSLPALSSSLQTFNCQNNQLTSLPALPSSLQTFNCQNNQLTSLPALPSSLQTFNCQNNQLTSLPALPSGLQTLNCYDNQLTSLPALPSGLQTLNCYDNQLISLPALPNGLQNLYCYSNQLISLPALPNGLQNLYCYSNRLTSLPALPSGLRALSCSSNPLTGLPALPGSLQRLACYNNQLTSLPALPSGLQWLICGNNQLTSFPTLPSGLGVLNCEDNSSLSCLPLLPQNVNVIFSGTSISCLPNYTSRLTQANTNLPLCTNPNQICQVNPMARGVVFNDSNNNGVRDTLENQIGGIPITISPNNWTNLSDTTSGYLVKLDTVPVTNTITPGYAYPYRTFTPSSYTVTTTSLGLVPNSYDFAMQVTQPNITDLVTHFSAWFHRPGFQTSASVNVENIGTIDQANASVSLEIPNGLSVISVTPATGVVNGNTVTWSGESIAIFERKNYSVSLQVPPTMPLGSSLTYSAQATPANTDFTPADNAVTETVVVRGSYDPNDKQVNKDHLPNNYVAADEEMLYTIRFQNTGTDTAFTVLVRDTLDLQKLDFSTFRVTGASHTLRTNVRERGVIEFFFNNINLPDSFVNEPLSHGYVQFRIHPKANLPLSTQIRNRAFIYFDFNAPIITNYATTTVGLLSLNEAQLGSGSLSLYPVPVAEVLNVNFNAVRAGEVRYRLLDLQGRILQEQQVQIVEGENITTMDTSKLGSGMYVLQVLGEDGSLSTKLVKE